MVLFTHPPYGPGLLDFALLNIPGDRVLSSCFLVAPELLKCPGEVEVHGILVRAELDHALELSDGFLISAVLREDLPIVPHGQRQIRTKAQP
jgi:hypothetical protein